jgi:hypothetical protein
LGEKAGFGSGCGGLEEAEELAEEEEDSSQMEVNNERLL